MNLTHIMLSFSVGFAIGALMVYDWIKQDIKSGIVRFGNRVYRVVHETKIRKAHK